MIRVSQDITASVVLCFVKLYIIGASFSMIECAFFLLAAAWVGLAGFVDRLIKSGMHTVTRRYKIIPGILHMRHILNYGICLYGDYKEKRKQI